MKRPLTPVLFLLTLAVPVHPVLAQQPTVLSQGRTVADSIAAGETDTYAIDVEAGTFVLGSADQQTVDVVVTVFGPDGRQLTRVDGPAEGPEWFRFETDVEGRHRIEVSGFEGDTGRYTVTLTRVEPVATSPEARVDQVMALYDRDGVPGGVVAVVRGGELAFARAYGEANLTYDVPFGTDTRNNIGSTSKQFTAFAILLLAERGELSLDDEVRTHIPELPAFDHPVTLRHLLTHTSGYREYLNALALAGRRVDEGDYIDRAEVIELVKRQPELQNEPGAEWNYNNTGYSLLTTVVERVTGESFPDWMQANVFDPLGMDATVIRNRVGRVIPGSATGYLPAGGGSWREADGLSGLMGAGGMFSTVADLARWMDNFSDPTVGAPEAFEQMTTRYVLSDGDTTGYGFGLFVDEYRGLRRVHHGGADVAHRSMLLYFPALDAGVITQSNNATFDAGGIADDVVDAFFAGHLEPEDAGGEAGGAVAQPFDPESYDPESFDRLAGRYSMTEMPSFILRFFREDDALFLQATGQPRVPIRPTSDTTFEVVGVPAAVTFHPEGGERADSLTFHQNGDHPGVRVEDGWQPSDDELEAFAGRYFSPELQAFYVIETGEAGLVLHMPRRTEGIPLEAGAEPDVFTGPGFPIARVEFERDASGEVTGLRAGNVRTRDVRFERYVPADR